MNGMYNSASWDICRVNAICLPPLKLLDRFAAVVPPPRVHRHRYFSVLAPNSPRRSALTALALVATTSPPPHPARNPPPNWRIVVPPATLGRGCSPASMEVFPLVCSHGGGVMRIIRLHHRRPNHARHPRPPRRTDRATPDRTRPRPAAIGACPMPGQAPSTLSPHRSTNSINASLGNAERRPPAKRAAGQAHAGARRTRDASSLTLPKHPHPGLPWPRGDP